MAHPPLPQQRPPTATTLASHHRHKPISTNATLKKKKKTKTKTTTREIDITTNLKSTTPSQNPKSRRDGGKQDQRDLDSETQQRFGPSHLEHRR